MTGWAEIVAGLIRAFNLIAGWVRDAGLIRRGAEWAELESLKRQKSVQSKADEIDERTLPDRDRDVLDRL